MSKSQAVKLKKQGKVSSKSTKKANRQSNGVPAGTAEAESMDVADDDIDTTPGVHVTRETLDGTPVRALTLLKAIGTSAAIRAAMAERGYKSEDHFQGWQLLHAASGYHEVAPVPEDTTVRDAIKQVDDWDEGGFQIISATLRYRFPVQAAFVLDGLQASTGAAAVLGVKQLLDRLDALESATDRVSTKPQDLAAIALLAERGINASERQRLRNLITVAESAPELSLPDADTVAKSEAAVLRNLMALRAWYEEWSGIARVVIKRRDYLIRMGLAKRRVLAVEPPAPPGTNPAAA